MTVEGVDYAFSRPPAAALVAAGKHFAVRYGGPGTSGKWLTAGELRSLVTAGLTVVANAEGTAGGFVTRSAGVSWARSAETHFRGLGMPVDRPIYFSVDFDVTSAGWPGVAEALRGAASVIGGSRVGIYGSYNAMVWSRRDRLASWWWQTYAWSGGKWAPGNHIEQYRNGVAIGGADCDLDRALTADFGQWPGGDDMAGEIADKALQQLDGGNALGEVYLRLLRGAGASGEPSGDGAADANLTEIVALLKGVQTALGKVQVTPTAEQWATLTAELRQAVKEALGTNLVKAGTLQAFREIGANIPPEN